MQRTFKLTVDRGCIFTTVNNKSIKICNSKSIKSNSAIGNTMKKNIKGILSRLFRLDPKEIKLI